MPRKLINLLCPEEITKQILLLTRKITRCKARKYAGIIKINQLRCWAHWARCGAKQAARKRQELNKSYLRQDSTSRSGSPDAYVCQI